jgi:hypothetical protein
VITYTYGAFNEKIMGKSMDIMGKYGTFNGTITILNGECASTSGKVPVDSMCHHPGPP